MITNLPLLPSSWSEWDWAKSNGNASEAQTRTGHDAILHQGQCSAFSRLVWNDLVDCTARVISEAGLTWDATYCSANTCKINTALGALTATMFNSVALNIHRFGFVAWKWAVRQSKEGYVGRDCFQGYSSHKADADFLYGWYIEELTSKLNRVIQVLKEEADFGEFMSNITANAILDTSLFSAKAGILHYSNSAIAVPYVALAKIKVIAETADVQGLTIPNGFLLPLGSMPIQTDMRVVSNVFAKSDGIRTAPMDYAIPIETHTDASLLPLVFVGYLRYNTSIETKVIAPLDISNIIRMVTRLTEESHNLSLLSKALSFPVSATGKGNSLAVADFRYVESLPIKATPYSHSDSFAESIRRSSLPLIASPYEQTSYVSVLHRFRPLYIQRNIQADSHYVSKMNILGSSPMDVKICSFVPNVGEMIAREIRPMVSSDYEVSAENVVLNRFRPVYVDSSQKSSFDSNTVLTDAKPLPIITNAKSDTKANAHILRGIPRLVNSITENTSYGTGVVVLPSVRKLSKILKSHSYVETDMAHTITKVLESYEIARTKDNGSISLASGNTASVSITNTNHLAVLENYAIIEVDWLDPIRENDNLYVRQVYNPWDKNDVLYLDAELWYVPIRIGNNLYIRSEGSIDGGNLNDG